MKSRSVYEKALLTRQLMLTFTARALSYKWDLSSIQDPITAAKLKYGLEIDPNELTVDELQQIGSVKWSEEDDLWLIPLWMHQFLPAEFMGGSISDAPRSDPRKIKSTQMDLDDRGGLLAFGVRIKDKS